MSTDWIGSKPDISPTAALGSWIALLLVQSTLMATRSQGHKALHMKLGIVAVAPAPAVVISMVGVVASVFTMVATIPPEAAAAPSVIQLKALLSNLLLEQSKVVLLFPAFVIWALLVRKQDPETHERLIILATLLPLPAAFDRMTWLPTTQPDSPTMPGRSKLDVLTPSDPPPWHLRMSHCRSSAGA